MKHRYRDGRKLYSRGDLGWVERRHLIEVLRPTDDDRAADALDALPLVNAIALEFKPEIVARGCCRRFTHDHDDVRCYLLSVLLGAAGRPLGWRTMARVLGKPPGTMRHALDRGRAALQFAVDDERLEAYRP